MTDTRRAITIERIEKGRYAVRNGRGGTIEVGGGDDHNFTAVELLLAAIGCCTGADVDYLITRRCPPTAFSIGVSGDKVRHPELGNRMENLKVEFAIEFPEGTHGDAARGVLPEAMARSHDRLCTVSRTSELGSPIRSVVAQPRAS